MTDKKPRRRKDREPPSPPTTPSPPIESDTNHREADRTDNHRTTTADTQDVITREKK